MNNNSQGYKPGTRLNASIWFIPQSSWVLSEVDVAMIPRRFYNLPKVMQLQGVVSGLGSRLLYPEPWLSQQVSMTDTVLSHTLTPSS